MADDDPSPPLPTPTAQTAIKQAVATAHDAPDGTPVDGESPLPPRPLFTMPQSPSAQDNIFDDSDDDACLAEMQLPPSTSSHSRERDGVKRPINRLDRLRGLSRDRLIIVTMRRGEVM